MTSENISYTETFDLADQFAIAELGLSVETEARLKAALDWYDADGKYDHNRASRAGLIEGDIRPQIEAKLREHGVNTATGEWLGEWSAEEIVTGTLDRHGA